ncbi:MAG: hypothetical protein COA82_13520 [Alkaliphilus sp.]|nr:helix-turn-helix transcriptional regulator [bacterium AH-315-L21]MBN4069728.1 helix-turn-helix transcriptional regulator [bacterium AH-315-G05]PHS28511.1 MAG: hypothetical protein COA82_13520 [Alkaliphilus sp.]
MFVCFELCKFGKYLKKLRESLGHSLEDVKHLSNISTATLKKIEAGRVLPRFDTLEYLSIAYKKDLLEDLKNYRYSSVFFHYYLRLDSLIIEYDLEVLKNLEKDFNKFSQSHKKANLLLESSLQKQFNLLLKGISIYYSSTPTGSLNCFIDAMNKSNPLFHLSNFRSFKYSCLELRILLLISLALVEFNRLTDSNSILKECLAQSNFDEQATFNEKLLILKTYLNLSYNFHLLDFHRDALSYAQQGIDFCNKHHISYALAALLARKGTAEYLLNMPNYKTTLNKAVTLLSITNKKDLAHRYIKIALESYGIILDVNII